MIEMPAVFSDGATLPVEEPMTLLADGRYNQVPVILGTRPRRAQALHLPRSEAGALVVRHPARVQGRERRYRVTSGYAA